MNWRDVADGDNLMCINCYNLVSVAEGEFFLPGCIVERVNACKLNCCKEPHYTWVI